jgi:FkbM family methyltransferase
MKIAIIDIIGLPYDGTTVYRQGLGGSESAVTYMSAELAALGFEVTVFNNCNIDHAQAGKYSGVTYRPLSDLAHDHYFDIVVSSRTIIPFMPPERYHELQDNRAMPLQGYNIYNRICAQAKMRVLWMHDTFCLGDNYIEELAVGNRITDIFTLSDFHLTYVANCNHGRRRNFEVLKSKLFITRNGAKKFDVPVNVSAKDRNLFVYNASVTKGMIPLVNEIWPMVRQVIPTARLKVIGGYYRFSEAHGPDQQEQDWRRMVADPKYSAQGIEFTGVIPQSEIAEILAQAYMMIYPGAFPETFGISSLESLIYNTPVATCRFGALEEIVPELAGYHLDYAIEPNSLFTDIDRSRQCQLFADMVIRAWNNPYLHQQKQYYCNAVKDIAGWDSVALQWKQWFYRKTGNYLSRDQYRRVSKINHAVHKIWGRRYTNTVEFESYKSGQEQPIRVVSTFYNAEQYIGKFITSVACQDYNSYEVYMVNDASTDSTAAAIHSALAQLPAEIAQKFHVVNNRENRGAVANQVAVLRALADTDSIVMVIDGDDWLVNDNSIFSYYNTVYDGTVEFTYGSCWSVVDNIPLISQPYPAEIKQARAYRKHQFNWILPYTHLRTFKSQLIKNIPDSAFQDSHGQWYRAGGDGSTFYNLIEAADPAGVRCLPEIVYCYNDASPLNDYKVNGQEQNRTAQEIVNRTTEEKKESPKMDYIPVLENEYQWACDTPSDINQHLPLLRSLADECNTVVELGVRTGISTRALLVSRARLYSYDISLEQSVTNLFNLAKQAGKVCSYESADSLTMTIPETDLLFIDTYHTYAQLSAELRQHHSRAKKYIAFHDTFTYGLKTDQDPKKGILTAIMEFMVEHPEWRLKYHTSENNGFTVLEKSAPASKSVTTMAKKILVAIPTARNIEAETFKSIYDLEVPDGYRVDFQYFYGYNIDQVRNLIADWVVRGYDYLFSVDSDIAFPPDTLKRLLAHNVDMVSGLYIQRKPGQHTLEVYEHNGQGGVSNIPYGKIKGRGLVEIASSGFGCVLVRGEVMRAIPYPHFKYHSAIDHRNTISEDVDFCKKALAQGFKIWADTDIQCRHIGSSEFLVDNNIPAVETPVVNIQDRLRELGNQRLLPKTHIDYLLQLKLSGYTPKVVYDIGSCVMHWTNESLRIWPDAHYVLFEAMPSVEFLYQERGIRDYHIGVLASESGRTVEFWQNDYHPGGNSYYKENVAINPGVPEYFMRKYTTKTLAEVVAQRQFPLPDLVKMDVQGAEMDIVRGAEGIIKHAQHVILELQKVEYNTGAPLHQEVIAYMDQLGFDCLGIFSDNGPDGDYHFVRR